MVIEVFILIVFSLLQLGYFECQIPIYDNVMHLNPMRPMMI